MRSRHSVSRLQRATRAKNSMKTSRCYSTNVVLKEKRCNSYSQTLKSCLKASLKISTTCWTVVKYPIYSLQKKKSPFVKKLSPKQEKLDKEMVVMHNLLTLYLNVVRNYTSYLHSLLLVKSSETDADSSPLSLIVVRLIGTIYGPQKPSTLLQAGNTTKRKTFWPSTITLRS